MAAEPIASRASCGYNRGTVGVRHGRENLAHAAAYAQFGLANPQHLVGQCAKLKDWFLENGCWYLGSTTFHAVALFCIGLIAVAMPHVVPDKLAAPPVFETPAADTPEGELARFDLGQTPEYPTKLDADTIAQLRAMPIGTQNGSDNAMVDSDGDDPGGHLTDQKGPILDGFNGPGAGSWPGRQGRHWRAARHRQGLQRERTG